MVSVVCEGSGSETSTLGALPKAGSFPGPSSPPAMLAWVIELQAILNVLPIPLSAGVTWLTLSTLVGGLFFRGVPERNLMTSSSSCCDATDN